MLSKSIRKIFICSPANHSNLTFLSVCQFVCPFFFRATAWSVVNSFHQTARPLHSFSFFFPNSLGRKAENKNRTHSYKLYSYTGRGITQSNTCQFRLKAVFCLRPLFLHVAGWQKMDRHQQQKVRTFVFFLISMRYIKYFQWCLIKILRNWETLRALA